MNRFCSLWDTPLFSNERSGWAPAHTLVQVYLKKIYMIVRHKIRYQDHCHCCYRGKRKETSSSAKRILECMPHTAKMAVCALFFNSYSGCQHQSTMRCLICNRQRRKRTCSTVICFHPFEFGGRGLESHQPFPTLQVGAIILCHPSICSLHMYITRSSRNGQR